MSETKNSFSPASKVASFSPVAVAVSPASKIAQSGNLTGLPRTIRDAVADLYNLVQRWNKEHLEGCLVLSKLAEIKKSNFQDARSSSHNNLQPLCDLLEASVNVLAAVVENMEQLNMEMEATQRLADLTKQTKTPLFLTWHITQFVQTFRDISSAYTNELQVKKLVLSKVAWTSNETALSFFVSSWIHQPTLSSAITIKLEASLLETGLH